MLVTLPAAACGGDALRLHEERAFTAWNETRAQYGRRAEVLPALLALVRAHAPQEREVLAEVEEALVAANAVRVDEATPRDPVRWREYLATHIRLTNAVQQLLATVERYLDLKRNAGYLALQSQLVAAQDRAAVARGDYNAAARAYNAELEGAGGWLMRLRRPDARPLQLFRGLPAQGT